MISARQTLLGNELLSDIATATPLGVAQAWAADMTENTYYRQKFQPSWAVSPLQGYGKVDCKINIFHMNWWGTPPKFSEHSSHRPS